MIKDLNQSQVNFQGKFVINKVSKEDFKEKTKELTLDEQAHLKKTLTRMKYVVEKRLPETDTVEISFKEPLSDDERLAIGAPRYLMSAPESSRLLVKYTAGEETKKLKITDFVRTEYLQGILDKDFALKTFEKIANKVSAIKNPLSKWFVN